MIPLTDERLRQLAYDDMVCISDSGRAMAVELIAARTRIAALEHLARTLWERRRQWQTNAIEVVSARARIAELEAERGAAADLVRQALHLRQYGERAPGWRGRPNETWDEWEASATESLTTRTEVQR